MHSTSKNPIEYFVFPPSEAVLGLGNNGSGPEDGGLEISNL
jgi:hypothetical protein